MYLDVSSYVNLLFCCLWLLACVGGGNPLNTAGNLLWRLGEILFLPYRERVICTIKVNHVI